MAQFSEHLNILTDSCKAVIEQMTQLKVKNVIMEKAEKRSPDLPFAHMISYTDHEKKVEGNFILAFENNEAALNLASGIAERLGLDGYTEICDDSTDLLNEFLNVVVGRTISEWDSIGLSVKFGTPVFKKNHKSEESKNLQAFIITMEVLTDTIALDEDSISDCIVFRVDFLDKKKSKIKGKRILIVEDSKVMRGIIGKILKKEGAIIKEAGDGEEAIKVQRTFRPDITLMDINMPKMDGLESITHIREFDPHAKFIILSSSSRKDEIISAKTLNVAGYLLKPVDTETLLTRVSDLL